LTDFAKTLYVSALWVDRAVIKVLSDRGNGRFHVAMHRLVLLFSTLHGMPARTSDEKRVRPSVKRVDCDKIEERSVQIFIPHERSFSLVDLLSIRGVARNLFWGV